MLPCHNPDHSTAWTENIPVYLLPVDKLHCLVEPFLESINESLFAIFAEASRLACIVANLSEYDRLVQEFVDFPI